jgi:hypothetical protein
VSENEVPKKIFGPKRDELTKEVVCTGQKILIGQSYVGI